VGLGTPGDGWGAVAVRGQGDRWEADGGKAIKPPPAEGQ